MTQKEKRAKFRELKKLPALTTAKTLANKERDAKTSAMIERLKPWRDANNLSQRQV